VVRFPSRAGLKVPHIGWNNLLLRAPDAFFAALTDPTFAYFVHSFYPWPSEAGIITAASTHGVEFAAACRRGKVRGVQFHPEKSQATGLRMLENFVAEICGGEF
jgi:glutamine amidotransferase